MGNCIAGPAYVEEARAGRTVLAGLYDGDGLLPANAALARIRTLPAPTPRTSWRAASAGRSGPSPSATTRSSRTPSRSRRPSRSSARSPSPPRAAPPAPASHPWRRHAWSPSPATTLADEDGPWRRALPAARELGADTSVFWDEIAEHGLRVPASWLAHGGRPALWSRPPPPTATAAGRS